MDPKRNVPYSQYIYGLVESDINALMKQPTKELKSNLTCKEHTALEELARSKDLAMTKADEGAGVVIKEANRQLSEKVSYFKTQHYNIRKWLTKQ